jgi:type IV secretory pathway TraG/TraD family ATPase VirD4
VTRQQKNTSFGANEFRDGVSYSEQMQRKQLVEPDDLASLAIGECYTLFSEPDVRLSKMQTPKAHLKDKNPGFVEKQESSGKSYKTLDAKEDLAIENMADDEDVNDTSDSHTGASADVLSRLEIDIQNKNEATDLEK